MAVKKTSTTTTKTRLPLLKYGGDLTYDKVAADQVAIDPLDPTNTDINYDQVGVDPVTAQQISAGTVKAGSVSAGNLANQFMTAADYTLIDPSEIASEYGDINREQITKNSALSSELALNNLDTELQGLKNFAPAAAALKRGETALDNTFNQSERDRQIAAGDPNLKADLEGQRQRANAYANGGVPSSIQDKALELGIQSRATDAAAGSGFGVRSSAAQKAGTLMSAEERIKLSQYGDSALTSNINNRANLLLAPTQYSDAGSQIKVTPTQSAGQVALGIASEANAGNVTAKDALSSLTQQSQFKTSLEQDTRTTNVKLAADRDLNQANLDLNAGEFNVNTDLQAQTTNVQSQLTADQSNQSANLSASQATASNSLTAQTANANNAIQARSIQIQTQSNEAQFNKNLALNVQTANATNNFNAANANAGRALQVASDNRTTQLDIQKTNSNMIFQDQQRKLAEAAQARASAAANAAANARAAMSASASAASNAANIEMQKNNFAFQLQQQQAALDAYNEGKRGAQNSQDWATVGTVITRAPTIVSGVGSLVTGIGNAWNYVTGDSSSSDSGGSLSDYNIGDSAPDFSTSYNA